MPAMAKRPLKVFRTSIGFQDAYVAATSRKAALEAWGTTKDLFAAGLAELVSDARLTKAPLAQPGAIIRIARGTTAQHLAAAKPVRVPRPETHEPEAARADDEPPPPLQKRRPRPRRTKLDRAEAALERKRSDYERALHAIDARMDVLHKEREQLRSRRDAEIARLEDRRTTEDQVYRDALGAWEE
jgi:hypothetical protein